MIITSKIIIFANNFQGIKIHINLINKNKALSTDRTTKKTLSFIHTD